MLKNAESQKGQTLFEVLVAFGVVVIVILALVRVTTTSIRNATFAKNQALATKYAQEWMEEARKLRDEQPESTFFVGGSCSDSESVDIFTRTRTCDFDGDKTMTVEVTVSWTDAQGTHKSELTTRLTKWK